jgi:hypothetical protein
MGLLFSPSRDNRELPAGVVPLVTSVSGKPCAPFFLINKTILDLSEISVKIFGDQRIQAIAKKIIW